MLKSKAANTPFSIDSECFNLVMRLLKKSEIEFTQGQLDDKRSNHRRSTEILETFTDTCRKKSTEILDLSCFSRSVNNDEYVNLKVCWDKHSLEPDRKERCKMEIYTFCDALSATYAEMLFPKKEAMNLMTSNFQ